MKCDGGKPICGFCQHLGRDCCEYTKVSKQENLRLRCRKRELRARRASEREQQLQLQLQLAYEQPVASNCSKGVDDQPESCLRSDINAKGPLRVAKSSSAHQMETIALKEERQKPHIHAYHTRTKETDSFQLSDSLGPLPVDTIPTGPSLDFTYTHGVSDPSLLHQSQLLAPLSRPTIDAKQPPAPQHSEISDLWTSLANSLASSDDSRYHGQATAPMQVNAYQAFPLQPFPEQHHAPYIAHSPVTSLATTSATQMIMPETANHSSIIDGTDRDASSTPSELSTCFSPQASHKDVPDQMLSTPVYDDFFPATSDDKLTLTEYSQSHARNHVINDMSFINNGLYFSEFLKQTTKLTRKQALTCSLLS